MIGCAKAGLRGAGAVGGGSVCNVLDPHEDENMNRALTQVTCWERSMRSKSPLSNGAVDEDDAAQGNSIVLLGKQMKRKTILMFRGRHVLATDKEDEK